MQGKQYLGEVDKWRNFMVTREQALRSERLAVALSNN